MNEELTNEVLEAMKKCGLDCARCGSEFCSKYDWKERFFVNDRNDGHSEVFSETYHRELQKTRTRQIAENIVHGINGESRPSTAVDIEYVEGVLKRYAEELKGEE